ncbi:type II CRISPR RNA-guided endonuclease Cas9 [Methyloraptor flagellatus]|uniref:CRISPR-associated endonuclease Cas9 n=1 Tax=Methyloraptor flagellatus TaxID=3162530 RepID=A0AAU7X5B8_9HYPH
MLPNGLDVRFAIDLGSTSLGWCVLHLDDHGAPRGIVAMGSRIFSDGREPKSKASLAIARRAARAMRRRRDRFLRRRDALLRSLTEAGLFPADPVARKALERLDPYELRAKALDEPLAPHHLGRLFFHLNQRRGFKSNRKTDRSDDDESGKIAVGVDRLVEAMRDSGARTLGEFLHRRRQTPPDPGRIEKHVAIPSIRIRQRPATGEGARGIEYEFYPSRALIEDEFEQVFERQAGFHPTLLTPEVHAKLHEIVFFQRPLKEPKIGKCTLIPTEERLPKAHPLFQRRRLLEEVNALEIVVPGAPARKLQKAERDLLVAKLQDKQKVSFETLRKLLRLDPAARFNKESTNRKDLIGDEIRAQFSDKKRFGNRWVHLTPTAQWRIIEQLRDEEDIGKLLGWLEAECGLTSDQAKAVASARLPEGYGRFGPTATEMLIEQLAADVIVYSEAVARAGLGHHSDYRTGEIFTDPKGRPALPYYGVALERHIMPGTAEPTDPEELRVGRITNPTVHIGLNQLRRVVNALIRRFGVPKEIVVELARELKLSEDRKSEIAAENARNRRAAEQRSQKLRDELRQPDTGANRALLKLWEELGPDNVLDRRCVYSGRQISATMLFDGSVEVDHILPFALTLDDGNDNRILALREANRLKRRRTPHEARLDFEATFGPDASWDQIAARAAKLPRGKRWRFEPDALAHFDAQGGFEARQLIDTQYLARLAAEYLRTLYPDKGEGSGHVWVSPGRLTELIRRKLGLNELLPDHNFGAGADQPKNRLDHRHHALDAFVIGITDRGLLNRIARDSARDGYEGRERVIVPDPWPGFRDELRKAVNAIVVSHRPDHGTAAKAGLKKGRDQTAGRLHNDTAYGLTGEIDARGNTIVVHRIPLTGLDPSHLGDSPARGVRDPVLRAALRRFTQNAGPKDFEAALRRFSELGPLDYRGIRRVRVVEPLSVIPVKDDAGRAYKGYKGDSNYRYDVWELPNGDWRADVVSMFDAHQQDRVSPIRAGCPTARKVLSLRQNDVIAVEQDGNRRLMRVVKFRQNGQITLADPQEAGDLKRRDETPNEQDPFKYTARAASALKQMKARQVRIDELGRVFDPGFPARKTRRRTKAK